MLVISQQRLPVIPEKLKHFHGARPAVNHVSHRNRIIVRHLFQQCQQIPIIPLDVSDQVHLLFWSECS